MTTKKLLLILALFILALTGIRLAWIQWQSPAPHAQAVQGVLDLRDWDRLGQPSLSLKGEWEFYPYELVVPTQLNGDMGTGSFVIARLPGLWEKQLPPHEGSGFRYGSYRLRILVEPGKPQAYGIQVPSASTASALYVNGERIGHAGEPAVRPADYVASTVPYTATFTSDQGVLDIVLHVATNYKTPTDGLAQPIRFGTKEALDQARWFSVGMQLAVCLIMLMHALYSCFLYVIGARQKALLYFPLLLASAIMTIIIDDDRLLHAWFPVSYDWNLKLYYLSYLGIAVFILQYAKWLLPPFAILKASPWYMAVCGLYAAMVLVIPINLLSDLDTVHTVLMMLPYVVLPILMILAVRQGVPDIIFLVLGVTSILLNIIGGVIKNAGWVEMGFYPVDILVTFITFALFWFRGYFRNSNQTANLAARLQASDKLKDEFLANTSHELRNPLHGMLNLAQTVLDSDTRYDEARNKDHMNLLISVGKRMSFMLNDLLDLTRFKENQVRLQLASFHVQAVASGVLDMLRLMTEGKPIRLVNAIPSTLPAVHADENRLIQILFNLLHNAVKFTYEGRIKVDAYAKDNKVFIEVSDTGVGMNAETLRRIFEPYEQGDVRSSTSITGLGLGLTISKHLVELHQGTLHVSSTPGQGTTFTFSLPAADIAAVPQEEAVAGLLAGEALPEVTEAAAGAETMYAEEAHEDRPLILAIDDDTINLSILVRVLGLERYDIVTTTSGADALKLLDTRSWDLVITDVMMPRMSGYEVTQAIRARFSRAELPILLVTARSRPEDLEAGFRFGANDYVTKPVDARELKSRVQALTEVTRAGRERMRMEAAWLQAQIQPHFLFNTLNSLAALSEFDIDRMRKLLGVFSDYLRASFEFHNSSRVVPLGKELELVRAYVSIEKERFGNRIEVEWDVEDHLPLFLPPLSLQPLVENAVRHGLMKRSRGGKIRISITDHGAYAEIDVSDDGMGMDEIALRSLLRRQPTGKEDRQSGVGLVNTDRRLKQLYGEGLKIESVPGEGTRVSFRVKKQGDFK